MQGRWRATGCGILRYRRHRALRRLFFHGVHTHRETVAEIAEVLLQRSCSGFTGLEAIRFSRGLAYCPPALDASPVVGDDLNNVDHSHPVPLPLRGQRAPSLTGARSPRLRRRRGRSLTRPLPWALPSCRRASTLFSPCIV